MKSADTIGFDTGELKVIEKQPLITLITGFLHTLNMFNILFILVRPCE